LYISPERRAVRLSLAVSNVSGDGGKRSTLEMLLSINGSLGPAAIPEARLPLTFDLLWPQLEERLAVISAMPTEAPTRSSADMLAEILAIVRKLSSNEEREKQ